MVSIESAIRGELAESTEGIVQITVHIHFSANLWGSCRSGRIFTKGAYCKVLLYFRNESDFIGIILNFDQVCAYFTRWVALCAHGQTNTTMVDESLKKSPTARISSL